ncbi:MAG: 2-oxoacid:ferredoxin oxidoreductase subunit beta [Pseudomonadota bacterium]
MNKPLTAKDFATDQEVRWCPGCGDYAILKAVQKTLADIEADPDNTAFISGIGCSSRFPYYVNAYGFHTIHGRAPAIATGLKLSQPDVDVWLVTGDGDGLSIGGNHLLHVIRRNLDLQILLFNNEIYGLTKGQYSPTSRPGTRSPSSPGGSLDAPVSPCGFAYGAGAKFIARGIDTDAKGLPSILAAAHEFKGAAFVELFQNCIVYNKDVFAEFTEKKTAPTTQLHVVHGQPLVWGNGTKGLIFDQSTFALKAIDLDSEGKPSEGEVLVHDETNRTLARLLIEMPHPEFPMALGVIYRDTESNPFETAFWANHPTNGVRTKSIAHTLRAGNTWQRT